MNTTVAQVTLPLMTEAEADFIRAEAKARHPDVTFRFSLNLAATGPTAILGRSDGEDPSPTEKIALVVKRQELETDLGALLTATKAARKAQAEPVSPFRS